PAPGSRARGRLPVLDLQRRGPHVRPDRAARRRPAPGAAVGHRREADAARVSRAAARAPGAGGNRGLPDAGLNAARPGGPTCAQRSITPGYGNAPRCGAFAIRPRGPPARSALVGRDVVAHVVAGVDLPRAADLELRVFLLLE